MTGLCRVPGCSLIARVLVKDSEGDTLEVCIPHWQEAVDASDGHLRGVRLLDVPRCFIADCDDEAVAIVHRYDETPRPVCQHHLDSLSWVDVPDDITFDFPGWSGG